MQCALWFRCSLYLRLRQTAFYVSDPSTKVGENVNIDLVVRSDGGTVGDVSVTMNYDTSALEFGQW